MNTLLKALLPFLGAALVILVARFFFASPSSSLSLVEYEAPAWESAPRRSSSSPAPRNRLPQQPAPPLVPPPPVSPPSAPGAAPVPEAPDLFALLRNTRAQELADPQWNDLREGFRHLKFISAAGVEEDTGRLILIGEYAEEGIGLVLDDFLVALRASFFELESVGMTIDEDPANKLGPTMFVRYFGGTKDTHLGAMMFECDRLMKCLSQGKDNITGQPLRATFEGFQTKLDIVRALREPASKEESWSRFWLNIATERVEDSDPRGKSVVELSTNGRLISFVDHRVFIDTRAMVDPGAGRKLEDAKGLKSKSAEMFANQLTEKYAELGRDFPVFAQFFEASKLVVLADWIRQQHRLDFDWEMLHILVDKSKPTAVTTPSLTTEVSWREGSVVHTLSAFGGVTLETKTRVAKSKAKADETAALVERHRSEMRDKAWHVIQDGPGPKTIVLGVGPIQRGPPAQVKPQAPLRWTGLAPALRPSRRAANDPVLGRYELPVWKRSTDAQESLELPVLRTDFDAHYENKSRFESETGATTAEVAIPDSIRLTSSSRNIDIRFSTKPSFDPARREAFFKADTPNVLGYYPGSRTVLLKDLSSIQFDADGLVTGVRGGDKPNLRITHHDFKDGALAREQTAGNASPRAPPLRVTDLVARHVQSKRTANAPPGETTLNWTFKNLDTGKEMEVRSSEGQIHYMLK